MSKPILCVDFDGVIHSYMSKWTDAATISDPPVPGALRWLWKATEWFEVCIYSSRSKDPKGIEAMKAWLLDNAVVEFERGGDFPATFVSAMTFSAEKPAAFLTIDDRAYCFEGDWSEIDPADLLNFKPWNKRPSGTGEFPRGKLDDSDEGALKIGIAYDKHNGIVRVDFGKPVAWLGLPPSEAINIARSLLHHAGAKKITIET